MSFYTKMLRQKAVWWPLASASGTQQLDAYGQFVYGDPIEIDCRWEDTAEDFIASDGTTRVSSAVVFVDRDLTVGGFIFLGTLSSLIDPTDPKNTEGAMEILQIQMEM